MLDAGSRQDVVSQEKEKRKMAERRVRVSRFKVTKRSNHGIAFFFFFLENTLYPFATY